MMKMCSRCGQRKERSKFSPDKRTPDDLFVWCKACKNAYQNERRKDPVVAKKNREATKEYYHRTYQDRKHVILTRNQEAKLKARYGITTEGYHQMLNDQNGRCGICETDTPGGRGDRFHVDHNHNTGEVRGLLCWTCNRRLGVLENKEFVIAARRWLGE